MIDFYAWPTPNNLKIAIMLEETGLPYELHPINIQKREQFNTEFLKLNPNHKVPVIVDPNGPDLKSITLFESGAILLYLAEKTGRFIPSNPHLRWQCIQWLFFQMAGVGPMFGQAHHFLHFAAEKVPYAIDRYSKEVERLNKVMDSHLAHNTYFAKDYSIADMAIFPWIEAYQRTAASFSSFTHLKHWFEMVGERPAVKQARERLATLAEKV